ncbi:hypothetical protein SLA2020_132460 [Shorea laevis]
MRWLQNISFSSASSSASSSPSSSFLHSSSSSPKKHGHEDNGKGLIQDSQSQNEDQHRHHRRNHRVFRIIAPRFTRQRKLRHLSDQDLVSGKSLTEAEDPQALSRSPSSLDQGSAVSASATRSSSAPVAVPLPLPLPVPEADGEQRHPSSKELGPGKCVEDRDRDRDEDKADLPGGGSVPFTPVVSTFAAHDSRKTMEYGGDSRLSSRLARQSLNREESHRDEVRVNVAVRSATNSPFASPALSPHRRSAADVFPFYNMVPKGNQAWSAPEMPTVDNPGLPPPAIFDYTAFSTDNTPLHSPPNRSPRRNTRSTSGAASPLHPKLSLETPSTWPESNGLIGGHPLPLPPGAAMPSPSCSPLPSGVAMPSPSSSPLHPGAAMPSPSSSPRRPGAAMPSPSSSNVPVATKPESLRMNGQWQKGKLIGRGTFGSVYVASNRETGALCAMKEVEIFPDDSKSAESIKQLQQEIKVLSQLNHPNIVRYYGSEIVEDRFYIYLEYVHPGSIDKYVREHCGAITESVVRNFTRHILYGLAYLHSTKTIHRDIKGANLLVDASGVVKLADFGMARHLTGQRADLSLKGSPYWMAPELMQAVMQKDNSSDLALAVDIWSLGCTIIEMFTGKPPWSDYEGAAAMFKVMRDTPPIPGTLSPEGKDFLRCCFQRNPADRPSASTLLEHRFLKNSQNSGIQPATPLFNGMKSVDPLFSPREHPEIKHNQWPVLPNSRSTEAVTSESKTIQQSHHEASNLRIASRHSPRSTLESLPSLSPPRSRHSAHHYYS